jgi:hypothetical protein
VRVLPGSGTLLYDDCPLFVKAKLGKKKRAAGAKKPTNFLVMEKRFYPNKG